jgi:hypothetical protein
MTGEPLGARIERAIAARARLRGRPLGETVHALALAAGRWRQDAALAAALPAEARLTPPMVAAVLPLAAEALDLDATGALVEREYGPGALARPAPDGPMLVAHVLASNVPALALPAIALSCLAGAAVVVKSGRHDRLSAPAFARALAAVDPDLAATVVATSWTRGNGDEQAALGRAEVVVVSGGAAAIAALSGRVAGRLIAHGPRASVAAVAAAADLDAVADQLALDVALYEQRGCLSPHAVYVEDEGRARAFAAGLAAALERLAERLPPPATRVEERAALRLLCEEAEWTSGGGRWSGAGGTVVLEGTEPFRPTCGLRSVRVHPLAGLADLPPCLPPGAVECVGVAGEAASALGAALAARGVARVCRPGRMQRPRLSWPRGQLAPLGALRGRPAAPLLEVEP